MFMDDGFLRLASSIHLAATWSMIGLIWFVQRVHYPLFHRVGVEQFAEYEQAHTRLTTSIVAPLMLIEAATALVLMSSLAPWTWLNFGLLTMIWGSTAIVQIPCHQRLRQGFDAMTHRRLVRSNWLRTTLWTVRGLLVSTMLASAG
jgi:hypothetical protein